MGKPSLAEAPPAHGRLWAADRRAQLLEIAAELLESRGVDGVRIPAIAARAGVTRAVVYRFFPNRQAILLDLLEEFGHALQRGVEGSLDDNGLDDVEALLGKLFGVVCDTVSAQGTGVWRLLSSTGPDPDIEILAQEIRARITAPWFARVQDVTGSVAREAFALTSMIAATIPAIVELWIRGQLERDEAVAYLERGVSGLIREFTSREAP